MDEKCELIMNEISGLDIFELTYKAYVQEELILTGESLMVDIFDSSSCEAYEEEEKAIELLVAQENYDELSDLFRSRGIFSECELRRLLSKNHSSKSVDEGVVYRVVVSDIDGRISANLTDIKSVTTHKIWIERSEGLEEFKCVTNKK